MSYEVMVLLLAIWAIAAAALIDVNDWEECNVFQMLLGWFVMTLFTPVFYVADFGELLIEIIVGEEEICLGEDDDW